MPLSRHETCESVRRARRARRRGRDHLRDLPRPGTAPVPAGLLRHVAPLPGLRGDGRAGEGPLPGLPRRGARPPAADAHDPRPGRRRRRRAPPPDRARGTAGAPGGRPGDLYVVVSVAPHEQFRRDGADVVLTWAVPFHVAALGGTVTVPTLDGDSTFDVPAGTAAGRVFSLKGKGIPRLDGRGRGDQHVLVTIRVPKKMNAAQREAIQRLARRLRGRRLGRADEGREGVLRAAEGLPLGVSGAVRFVVAGAARIRPGRRRESLRRVRRDRLFRDARAFRRTLDLGGGEATPPERGRSWKDWAPSEFLLSKRSPGTGWPRRRPCGRASSSAAIFSTRTTARLATAPAPGQIRLFLPGGPRLRDRLARVDAPRDPSPPFRDRSRGGASSTSAAARGRSPSSPPSRGRRGRARSTSTSMPRSRPASTGSRTGSAASPSSPGLSRRSARTRGST